MKNSANNLEKLVDVSFCTNGFTAILDRVYSIFLNIHVSVATPKNAEKCISSCTEGACPNLSKAEIAKSMASTSSRNASETSQTWVRRWDRGTPRKTGSNRCDGSRNGS